MNSARRQRSARPALSRTTTRRPSDEIATLRARLADAEEALRAIRNGEVDAVVVAGERGPQVFTLEGAEHAYRMLIESMNEGALTLAADKTILYANQGFARMVKSPLEKVIGSSFRRFLSADSRATLQPLLKRAARSGSKIHGLLRADDGSQFPVQISFRLRPKSGFNRATFSVVVTDLTEARRNEAMLRALSRRLVEAQETERGRVALELHDNITQLLCAVLVRSQALADRLSAGDRASKREAMKLREMLGQTASEVERISGNLRPSVLRELGLTAILRQTSTAFAKRTGVSVRLTCVELSARLPADTELTLFRILQEALKNVERRARARHVTVRLRQQGAFVQLAIKDDGVGFGAGHHAAKRNGKGGLDLFGMQERATYVGGTLNVTSVPSRGTTILAQVPLIDRTRGGGREKPRLLSPLEPGFD